MLTRRDALDHVSANGALFHLVDEVFDHRQRDIGLKQRNAYFTHRRANIRFGERSATGQAVKYIAKAI